MLLIRYPALVDTYIWTNHSEFKMKYYRLSKQKVASVLRRPDRIEKGIAGRGTIAAMQAVSPKIVNGKKTWKQEIWMMYQKQSARSRKRKTASQGSAVVNTLKNPLESGKKIKIISAWRYPGISPKNNPIPEEIFREIMNISE